MRLQSLSDWWSSRLSRNDTESPAKICPNCGTVDAEQDIGNENVAVSIASAAACHIAARSVFELVEALDGDYAVEATILNALRCLSESARDIAETAINTARDIAEDAKHGTQVDMPIIINLEPVITAVFDQVRAVDAQITNDFDTFDRAKLSPYSLIFVSAAEKTMSDVNHAIANAIKAHIASIAAPTTGSIPSLEKLAIALAGAAAESMRTVVDTVMFMHRCSPPCYQSLKHQAAESLRSSSNRADTIS